MTKSQIGKAMKSALYKTLKWHSCEGEDVFWLKVPRVLVVNDKGAKSLEPGIAALRDWLKANVGEPGATYFDREGGVVAWQWRLVRSEHRALWLLPTPVVDGRGDPEQKCRTCETALKAQDRRTSAAPVLASPSVQ